jgi:hypothetical protein
MAVSGLLTLLWSPILIIALFDLNYIFYYIVFGINMYLC